MGRELCPGQRITAPFAPVVFSTIQVYLGVREDEGSTGNARHGCDKPPHPAKLEAAKLCCVICVPNTSRSLGL